jgi:hypothetical protein
MVAGMIWDPGIWVLFDWDPGYSESYQYNAKNRVACFRLHPYKVFENPDHLSLSSTLSLSLSSTRPAHLPLMARWLDGAPVKMGSPDLKKTDPRDHESAAEGNSRSTAGILARAGSWFGGA